MEEKKEEVKKADDVIIIEEVDLSSDSKKKKEHSVFVLGLLSTIFACLGMAAVALILGIISLIKRHTHIELTGNTKKMNAGMVLAVIGIIIAGMVTLSLFAVAVGGAIGAALMAPALL